MKNNFYLQACINRIPQLLSMQDRDPASKTYGSFDRTFWSWKFSDFPGARFQEGVHSQAFLYKFPFEGNYLFEQPSLLRWIEAGLVYWQKIQYKDGSFDEAYPFERSLGASAFTSFYLSEVFSLLAGDLNEKVRAGLRQSLLRAADWLCSADEKHGILSNHLAAAAAALYNIYEISGQARFHRRSEYFLEIIFSHQSKEGWFEEYGGADIGYLTHCLFFLEKIWRRSKDPSMRRSLERALEFISYFIHPDGTIGGEYGSRNTEFYFPAVFEILASEFPVAASVAAFLRPYVENGHTAGLAAMDAYNFFPVFNNYLHAGLNFSDLRNHSFLPKDKSFIKYFDDAGLYIRSTSSYYAVCGLSKGGVIKIFDKKHSRLKDSDCGYWGRFLRGDFVTTQYLRRPFCVSFSGNKLCLKTFFSKVPQKIFDPVLFIFFRLFLLTLGRSRMIGYFIKRLLVKILIIKKSVLKSSLKREIIFEEDSILIRDELNLSKGDPFVFLTKGSKFVSMHMGSSRYFQKNELVLPVEEKNMIDSTGRPQERLTEKCVRLN